MRHLASSLLFAASAAMALPVQFGLQAKTGIVWPELGDLFANPAPGMGYSLGPTVDLGLGERWALRASTEYLHQNWGYNRGGSTIEVTQKSLELSLAPVFKITPEAWVKAGYSARIPLLGGRTNTESTYSHGDTVEVSTTRERVRWAGSSRSNLNNSFDILSTHNLVMGGGIKVAEHLDLTLDACYGLTGILPHPTSSGYDGAQERSRNIELDQISLGARTYF